LEAEEAEEEWADVKKRKTWLTSSYAFEPGSV